MSVLTFALTVLASLTSVQDADLLFQRALHLEEVKGDLEGAIEIYTQLIIDPEIARSVAARATLHLGVCHQSLGRQRAEEFFRRVIEEFPDQTESVQVARQRLALLEAGREPFSGPVARRLSRGVGGQSVLSPDESRFAFTDWATDAGNLMIRDLASGEDRNLTHGDLTDPGRFYEFAEFPVWSPDSRRIAYAWFSQDQYWDVRVVSAQGGLSRVVFFDEQLTFFPDSWSPDGRMLGGIARTADGRAAVAVLWLDEGRLEERAPTDSSPGFHQVRFSPDSRYLLYDGLIDGNRDVYIVAVEGGGPRRLTRSEAADGLPVFAPDGRHILFTSNRSGDWRLLGLKFEEEDPLPAPFLVKADFGFYKSSVTVRGRLSYELKQSATEVFAVRLGRAGEVVEGPTRLSKTFYGRHLNARWSPDGKTLAFVRRNEDNRTLLCFLPRGDEQEECLETGMRFINAFFWAPDGRSLALRPLGPDGTGLYRFDLQQKSLKPILTYPDFRSIGWFDQGKSFLVTKTVDGPDTGQRTFPMVAISLEDGSERILSPGDQNTWGHHLTPDGRRWVYIEDSDDGVRRLIADDQQAGSKRILIEGRMGEGIPAYPRLSPDGARVAYLFLGGTQTPGAPEMSGTELRVVDFEGRRQQTVDPGPLKVGRYPPGWSPDGQWLSFTGADTVIEIWVLENFLPKE